MSAHKLGRGRVEFCEHDGLTDGDLTKLVRTIRDRVLRHLAGRAVRQGRQWAANHVRVAVICQESHLLEHLPLHPASTVPRYV